MANDEWRTPPDVFAPLDLEFGFGFDAAATTGNALLQYFAEGPCIGRGRCQCGLCVDWNYGDHGGAVWCNPPYSNILPWIEKAAESPVTSVLLVPGLYETAWFRRAWQTAWEERRLPRRVAFIDPETGKPVSGNVRPSSLLIWRPGKRPYAAPAVSYWDWRG